MNSTYTIATAQREFTKMVKRAEAGELAVVTRHEKPVAYLVSAERMEAMLETMELLSNPEFARSFEADRSKTMKYHPLDSIADA